MAKKTLIVIDMQNDFITGSLANAAAQSIVEPMAELIRNWEGDVVFTADTHSYNDYMDSPEGKSLPVYHCVKGTEGWEIESSLKTAALSRNGAFKYLCKSQFCLPHDVVAGFDERDDAEFYFVGTCTDICVVSNALAFKSAFPQSHVAVLSKYCAATTPANQEAALAVMRSCQIDVIE